MHFYYALWKFNKNRFDEPILYDYTFPVRFPNVVFRAKDLREAKDKIDAINREVKIDRFNPSYSRILRKVLA